MSTVAFKINDHAEATQQETARVVEVTYGLVRARTATAEFVDAERAASCLVAPETGDLVLLLRTPHDGAFVLAVLRRASDAATSLSVEGDLDVRVASGRLRIAAQQGVEVVTPAAVDIAASALEVNAIEGNVAVRTLTWAGGAVRAELERVKLLATHVDSVVERVTARVKRAYRTVEETDQLRAARIDYTAEKTLSLHAEHALVTADELVKVDAEQIHLG